MQDYFDVPTESLFYHREFTFFLPLVEYKSERYLNVNFLKDLFGIKMIEQGHSLGIFSEEAGVCPNKKALLPGGSKLYKKKGTEYIFLEKTENACEVYVQLTEESPIEEKLPAYLPFVGFCYLEASDLEDLSSFDGKKKRLRPSEKKEKYKALQMTWDVLSSYQESFVKVPTERIEGLDILIPTSFKYVGDAFYCDISHEYVQGAKALGYSVYGHFSNHGDAVFFRNILADENKKRELIDALLFYSAFFELDGINLDLSGLERSDREAFSDFFIALSERADALGLSLSLCVPPIDSEGAERKIFNKYLENAPSQTLPFQELRESRRQDFLQGFIDFARLKDRADYFVLMALDQYDSDSAVAGPVASLSWVEENLKTLLQELPSDRLILAQPSYLRIFTLDAQGELVLNSKISSHKELQTTIKSRTLKYLYDASARQEVIEFRDLEKPVIYRVWIDDETSLRARLAPVERYGLRGYASWSLAFEEAWQSRLKDEVLGSLR